MNLKSAGKIYVNMWQTVVGIRLSKRMYGGERMKSALISLTLMFLVEGTAYTEEPQQKPRKVPMLIQLTENCISKMEEYD